MAVSIRLTSSRSCNSSVASCRFTYTSGTFVYDIFPSLTDNSLFTGHEFGLT